LSSKVFSAGRRIIGCRFASYGGTALPEDPKTVLARDGKHEILLREQTIQVTGPSEVAPVSGIPEEQISGRIVRIYQIAKNAMQSGTEGLGRWTMEFDNQQRWENPLMGWCSTGDPHSNTQIHFPTKEAAIAHCEKYG